MTPEQVKELVERLEEAAELHHRFGRHVVAQDLEAAASALTLISEEREELRTALKHMLGAIESGGIDSEEIPGDYESGIPPHKWHEEWAYHARAALKEGS